jgi:acid phosphatase
LVCLASAQAPQAGHVVVVLEENTSYDAVVGNGAMPFFNNLASRYGLAMNYYANTHPSIGNYFMITTGQVITNDDGFNGVVDVDNVVRQLLVAGKSWKSYAEGLPSAGYTGGDVYPYSKHHNPFAYFSDVVNSNNQRQNLVPFSQFRADLNNGALPNYSFVIPNLLNDAHDGSLATADAWLQQNIGPLLNDAQFQRDGILVIAFDESYQDDGANGGGHIAVVVASPAFSRAGFRSGAFYQHQNLLRTTLAALDSGNYPGASADAALMADFFGSGAGPTASAPPPTSSGCAPQNTGVTLCSPTSGATVASLVTVVAAAAAPAGIAAMHVYVDDQLAYQTSGAALNTPLPMGDGGHFIVAQAWDNNGVVYKASAAINVSGGATGGGFTSGGCAAAVTGVTVCTPANGSTVGAPVVITAAARASVAIDAMAVYVDDQLSYLAGGAAVNTAVAMAGGSRFVVVQAWDVNGQVYKAALTISVR